MRFSIVLHYQKNLHKEKYRQLFRVGKRVVRHTKLYQQMVNNPEFQLHEATDVVEESLFTEYPMKAIRGQRVKLPVLGVDHPNYHEKPCLMYKDNDILTEGLHQAQNFTNTVMVQEDLPENCLSSENDAIVDRETKMIQLALASAVVYNTTEEKLPKKIVPERPMFNLPRDYGIPDYRKNYTLCHRFIHLCDLLGGIEISSNRYKLENAFFSVPLIRNEDYMMLQIRCDHLLLSNKPLKPLCDPKITIGMTLPSLEPLIYTIGLREENFYELDNIFPLQKTANSPRIHTAFIHYNPTEVTTLYKLPVNEDQTISRSLMKAYAMAAAEARHLYGENVEELPEPVVVQCVQTDAQNFQISIFQLNTLAWPPKDNSIRNIFWSGPITPMYEFGGYFEGKPTITSYNPDIFKSIFSLYMHN